MEPGESRRKKEPGRGNELIYAEKRKVGGGE